MKELGLIILALFWLSGVAGVARSEEVNWRELVKNRDLQSVHDLLEKKETVWPRIDSNAAAQAAGEARLMENQKNIQMVLELVELERADFIKHNGDSGPDLLKDAERWFVFQAKLKASQGYANKVVANAFAGLGGLRLAQVAIKFPALTDAAAQSLENKKRSKVFVCKEYLIDMMADDPALGPVAPAIGSMDEKSDVFRALQTLGEAGYAPGQTGQKARSTVELINSPSAINAMLQTTITESELCTILPATMEFQRNGGSWERLSVADVRTLNSFLGKQPKRFNYPPLQIRIIEAGQVASLRERVLDNSKFEREINHYLGAE
jgi:hypothetical protein